MQSHISTRVVRSSLAAGIIAVLVSILPHCRPRPLERPRAIVAADRSEHLLDRPYPSDEMRSPLGGVSLPGLPRVAPSIGQRFLDGWVAQAERIARGFSATTPIYFRFESQPALRAHYSGTPLDPVRLLRLDKTELVPVNVRWIGDSHGDPYLPSGTLVVSPAETHPLRSGARYLALVSGRVARRAEGWTPPREAARFDVAVATVFTVQDHAGELAALRDATDALIASQPAMLVPIGGLREVASLQFVQGATPAGRAATVETVGFADGGRETSYLRAVPGLAPRTIDVTSGPMAVYQATIHTAAFQDPSGRPWQSPGLGIVADTARTDGWIDFAADGSPRRTPTPAPMRVVVQVPRAGSAFVAVDWGHGSGGDAYEPVARADPSNDVAAIRGLLAERGVVIVSGDHPLFGTRFGFMEAGYDNNLLVVNIPNLGAFRANFQQGALDGYVRQRFARDVLPALLPPGVLADGGTLGAFGHSIGAQMAGVGAGLHSRRHERAPAAAFLNGTGGQLAHSVLASDLLQIQGTVGETIFLLAGLPPNPGATAPEVLGALLGVPPAAWKNVDRFHPLTLPFQLIVDGADPLAMAREHAIPIDVMGGVNDSKVAPEGFAWLAGAFRAGSLSPCIPSGVYDGHYCVFREPAGLDAFARLADRLRRPSPLR